MPRDRDPLLEVADELEAHAAALRQEAGSVTRLPEREPTAMVELTEDELRAVVEVFGDNTYDDPRIVREHQTAFHKLQQALAIESAPGGNFYDGGAVA